MTFFREGGKGQEALEGEWTPQVGDVVSARTDPSVAGARGRGRLCRTDAGRLQAGASWFADEGGLAETELGRREVWL